MMYSKIVRVKSSLIGKGKPHPQYPQYAHMRVYTESDFSYELEDTTSEYPDSLFTTDSKYGKSNLDVDIYKYKNLENLDISKLKNYMFIKGTKFNRDYFKRLMGHANKVILPKKAQIILYDSDALSNYLVRKVSNCYYASIDPITNIIYYGDYEGYQASGLSYYKGPNNNLNMEYGHRILSIKNMDLNPLKDKLVHIDDFLAKVNGLSTLDQLTISDLTSIFKQVTSEDQKVRNTALDTISSYGEKYYLIKFLCFYCASINSVLKLSSKSDFYKKKFNIYFRRDSPWGKFKVDPFEHIEQIVRVAKDLHKENEEVYETALFMEILNSQTFSDFIKLRTYEFIDVKFTIRNPFRAALENDLKNQPVSIEEFAL